MSGSLDAVLPQPQPASWICTDTLFQNSELRRESTRWATSLRGGMGNRNSTPRRLPPEASTSSVRRVYDGDVVVLCVDGAPLKLVAIDSSSNDSDGADAGAAQQYALVPAAPGTRGDCESGLVVDTRVGPGGYSSPSHRTSFN